MGTGARRDRFPCIHSFCFYICHFSCISEGSLSPTVIGASLMTHMSYSSPPLTPSGTDTEPTACIIPFLYTSLCCVPGRFPVSSWTSHERIWQGPHFDWLCSHNRFARSSLTWKHYREGHRSYPNGTTAVQGCSKDHVWESSCYTAQDFAIQWTFVTEKKRGPQFQDLIKFLAILTIDIEIVLPWVFTAQARKHIHMCYIPV